MSAAAKILIILAVEAIAYFAIYHPIFRSASKRFDEEMLQKKEDRARQAERPRPI